MRIVFLGSPPEAAVALRALHDAHHDIALVVTQPDRRRGRGGRPSPTPVKEMAGELGLPVVTPNRSREIVPELEDTGAHLGVVVAFGQLLPPAVLEALPGGYVNVHYSLLPRWRGAAPVERAILAGDEETGVSLMQLEEGLDTGPVYAVERVTVRPHEPAGELRGRLAEVGAALLVRCLDEIPHTRPEPQVGVETYAEKLTPAEFELDWTRPAADLDRMVRAGNPHPGAWTTAGGRRLKILAARARPDPHHGAPGELLDGPVVVTGSGTLALEEVQPEGKRLADGDSWYRGLRDVPVLGG